MLNEKDILELKARLKDQTLKLGDIVRLTRDIDRFPYFRAKKGTTGTVHIVGESLLEVRMHETLENCEEWENGIDWYVDEGDDWTADLEKIGSAPEPKTRAQQAIEEAEVEFWLTVARFYPEIETGDFPPCDASRFTAACVDAVETWIAHNPIMKYDQ